MSIDLAWMRAEAPYMPIVTVGLLSVLEATEADVAAGWERGPSGDLLRLYTALDADKVAQAVIDAPWPVVADVAWGDVKPSQGLKPTLKGEPDPIVALQEIGAASSEPERTFLRAVLTDGVRDNDGIPQRSRLLRGVKADLSSPALRPKKLSAESLAAELVDGSEFRSGSSGLGLGFVPEVQTFGGTTGPDPSGVGAYSPLLFLLLWHGLLALPPVTVRRGPRRAVGGSLVTAPDVLSWPRWRYRVGLPALRALLSWAEIHRDVPDQHTLTARGVDRVYRARAVPLNSMIAAYRWGERVG